MLGLNSDAGHVHCGMGEAVAHLSDQPNYHCCFHPLQLLLKRDPVLHFRPYWIVVKKAVGRPLQWLCFLRFPMSQFFDYKSICNHLWFPLRLHPVVDWGVLLGCQVYRSLQLILPDIWWSIGFPLGLPSPKCISVTRSLQECLRGCGVSTLLSWLEVRISLCQGLWCNLPLL